METPGLHHVILIVSDLARARTFYGDLLGFKLIDIPHEHGGGFMFRAGSVMIFLFHSLQPIEGDRFSEHRIGLDHLSFIAPGKEALYALADRLIAAGVETKGVEKFEFGDNLYVAFRDPDNIQLEYWLP